MMVFSDIFSGEEIVSDSFLIKPVFDGVGGEVDSKIIVKGALNVNIGCGDAFGKGGGEEGEEADDGGAGGDPSDEKVNNVLDAFKYQETQFSKAEYASYIKGYMKKLKTKLEEVKPDRVQPFMKGAQEMVKWILSTFDEFSFYTPESYENENIIILSYYKPDALAPTFVYFMDGLKGQKV